MQFREKEQSLSLRIDALQEEQRRLEDRQVTLKLRRRIIFHGHLCCSIHVLPCMYSGGTRMRDQHLPQGNGNAVCCRTWHHSSGGHRKTIHTCLRYLNSHSGEVRQQSDCTHTRNCTTGTTIAPAGMKTFHEFGLSRPMLRKKNGSWPGRCRKWSSSSVSY